MPIADLLQHGVSAQAQARPEALAVAFKGERLSYGALEEASNRLARALREAGCRRGDRVGLFMPKLPQAIVAFLGVLKADAVFVPLDHSAPPARQARMLQLAEPRCILAAGQVSERLRETMAAVAMRQPPVIGWLGEGDDPAPDLLAAFSQRDLDTVPATAPQSRNHGEDLAQILFTSGSTGVPKGVMVTHAGIAHFIRWAIGYFGIEASDRVSQHPPLRFDVSTFDIFGALWSGAELHLVPGELNLVPHRLAQFIRDARLTQWFSVPSALNLMAKFDAVRHDDFPELRRVLFAGEPLPVPTLIHWMQRVPRARYTNMYGPTETTISSSFYTVPECPADPREALPIGVPCDGEELLILDADLQPVAAGEIGEIYIAGPGLSPGYWRDAERSAQAFLQRRLPGGGDDRIYRTGDLARRDDSGLIHYLGRSDTQIKSRGYRIELGEIETALHSLPGLRESAVLAIRSDGFEGWQICCAYAELPGQQLTPARLREGLSSLLPGYMLPARWMLYEELPKNASGKIDRPRLQADFTGYATLQPAAQAALA